MNTSGKPTNNSGTGAAAGPGNNTTKGTNNKTVKTGANNKSNKNNSSEDAKAAGHYARNTPILILTGVFLFFILFQYLKALKYKEDRLKQKIDAEIRKKLYYADEYY